MRATHPLAVVGCTLVALLGLVFLGTRHYGGNVSGLLHMDVTFGEAHRVPPGIVLYEDGGYDGMLYYEVARELPVLVFGGKAGLDSPYRFQRIVLPALTYVVTLGNAALFPWALLLLNLCAALGSLALTLRLARGKTLHALTVVGNPAILVGILYTLTEPLSILFMLLFLRQWERKNYALDAFSLLALLLSLLARETTVFLIGLLLLWSLWGKKWKEAALLLVPVALFIGWQWFLRMRLGAIGFQANDNIVGYPFEGPLTVLRWAWEQRGLHQFYRFSSLALLSFLLPLCGVLAAQWAREKSRIDLYAFLLSGLAFTMLCMDPHMWGVITSIGRVVTPVYPVYAVYAARRDTPVLRVLSVLLIGVSVVAAVGIASVPHPYRLS